MNRIHRLVWNRSLQTVQVASELGHSPHGAGNSGASVTEVRRRPPVLGLLAALGMAMVTGSAWAASCPPGFAPVGSATGEAGTTAADGNGTHGTTPAGLPPGSALCLVSGYFVNGGAGGNAAVTGGHGGAGGNGFEGSQAGLANDGGIGGGNGGEGVGATGGTGGRGIVGGALAITNAGYIHGGVGGYGYRGNGGAGGIAIDVTPGATTTTIANNTTMRGGAGGMAAYGNGGQGAAGIHGSNFAVANSNSLFGGAGGTAYFGNGGRGAAAISGSDFTVANTAGGIGGGNGGFSYAGNGAEGGAAISGTDISVYNAHEIFGGAGGVAGIYRGHGYGLGGSGAAGGAGVVAAGQSRVANAAGSSITGGMGGRGAAHAGTGGAGVVAQGAGVSITTTGGVIVGGTGGLGGGHGGAGVAASGGANIVIQADSAGYGGIYGGAGSDGDLRGVPVGLAIGGNGGAGIAGDAAITSYGNAVGGNGGYAFSERAGNGGAGITGTGFQALNARVVEGGEGGIEVNYSGGGDAFTGGTGGAGASGHDFTLLNAGAIVGGTGGPAIYATAGRGGVGGGGDGFTLVNAGGVYGGAGGIDIDGTAGAGGVGVSSSGNSIVVNANLIAGGLSSDGAMQADAVHFSGGGNTLLLENGYAFTGNVVSSSGQKQGGDTLALGGGSDGTFDLAQVVAAKPHGWDGTAQYFGFQNFQKLGTSTWTVTGTAGGSFAGGIDVADGTLQLGSAAAPATLRGGPAEVAMGATLAGMGTIDTPLALVDPGATLAPGLGGLFFTGDLGMLGNLAVGIDGVGAGEFDYVGVGGGALFAPTSTFTFSFGGDGNQHAGDLFPFFDAGELLGFDDAAGNYACSGLVGGLQCRLGVSDAGDGLFVQLYGSVSAVPEPGSLGILAFGLGCLGLGVAWRRRTRRA